MSFKESDSSKDSSVKGKSGASCASKTRRTNYRLDKPDPSRESFIYRKILCHSEEQQINVKGWRLDRRLYGPNDRLMATCGFATQSDYSCAVRRGGCCGRNNKWRNRGSLETAIATALMLLATLPFLAGSTLGKGSSGITASKLGNSATRLAKLLPFKNLEESVTQAVALAELEQEIEDLNVMHKFDRRLERLAMVMPLTDHFDPGVTHFAHEHLQEGDKISVPASILSELIRKQAEVPWQFELKLVRRKAPGQYEPVDVPPPPREDLVGKTEMPMLSSVACSILDARSPETFIFVPDWMMKALRLKPRDIILYRHKDLNKASKVVLQPHSSAFLKMSNHQAVMETELRHYSALSRGTTIAFRYRKALYKFNVLECIDVDGKSQEAVCVQDSDVATDFQAALDTPAGRRQSESTRSPHSATHLGDDVDSTWGIDEESEEDEEGWGSDEF